MRVTIRDVAKQAGVSFNTVSRVLNNHPHVSPKTRLLVQQSIAELGYTPNNLARSLVSHRSRVIGLVVTDCTNPNTAQQIRAVQQTMSEAGYAVMIFDTQEDGDRQREALRILEEQAVDGVVISTAVSSDPNLARLAEKIPVVLLNRTLYNLHTCDAVLNDNLTGAYIATSYLACIGHTRIAYITADRDISAVHDRLRGYQAALNEAGIEFDPGLVVRTSITVQATEVAARRVMASHYPPTAFFTYNDFMAIGVISTLDQLKRRIPEDVALVGFDDFLYAPYLRVPLTTVAQQTEAMGVAAAQVLLRRLAGETGPPQRIVLAPHLVVRQSSERL